MLEEVKAKRIDELSTAITSCSNVTASILSEGICLRTKPDREITSKLDSMMPSVDSALEAQEDDVASDSSDVMEDAISDVTAQSRITSSNVTSEDKNEDTMDDSNGSSTKKRVHFADDSDNSIFRSASVDSLKDGNGSSQQRSSLRKRVSPHVNPRPPHLTRKPRESFQGDHLSITPADSLEFVVIDFQKETLDIINLKNKTEEVVTYKVKTTAPEKYRVRPSTGLIRPGASIDVNVYLPPGMHSTNRDKFLIMSLRVKGGEGERSLNEINDLWKSASKDNVVEHRIRCVLIDQSQNSLAEEGVAKEVADVKEALEKVNTSLAMTQRQCKHLEEIGKWNQFYLRIILGLFLCLLLLFLLIFGVSRRPTGDHCQNKYSPSDAHSG